MLARKLGSLRYDSDMAQTGKFIPLGLVIIASNFGVTENLNRTDINRDGAVNILDLVLIAGFLGAAPAAR